MRGVTFGTIHSLTDLNLILQEENISPAEPKTNFVDIPGADGSKDLTEAFGTGVKYSDGELSWVFALYPTDDWATKRKEVSGALNGLRCDISLDSDPGYYYTGRVVVSDYKADRMLRQITIKAQVGPYKLANDETQVSRDDLTGNYKNLTLPCGRMPVLAQVTIPQDTTIQCNGTTIVHAAGTFYLPSGLLVPGDNTLKAKITDPENAETSSITVEYRNGERY